MARKTAVSKEKIIIEYFEGKFQKLVFNEKEKRVELNKDYMGFEVFL
jgi:hypothetical protein